MCYNTHRDFAVSAKSYRYVLSALRATVLLTASQKCPCKQAFLLRELLAINYLNVATTKAKFRWNFERLRRLGAFAPLLCLNLRRKSLQSKLLGLCLSVLCTDVDIAATKAAFVPPRRLHAAFVFKYPRKSLL